MNFLDRLRYIFGLSSCPPLAGGWKARWIDRNGFVLTKESFEVLVYAERIEGTRRRRLDMAKDKKWISPKGKLVDATERRMIIELAKEELSRCRQELEVPPDMV